MASREIKFRVWHKIVKQMYNDGWHGKCVGEAGTNTTNDHLKFLQNHDMELMQYTGLKDKNGTEIYEGDIVDQLDLHQIGNRENPRKQTVIEFNPTSGYDIWPHDIEVIGNIYENPELLK